jgi:hypothetical protein
MRRNWVVRRRLQIAVSLSCLAVIGAGGRYAYGRETLRQTDPHSIYQQVNRESFQGALPDVPVTWAALGQEWYGTTYFYADGTAAIEIDKGNVLSDRLLRGVVQHEACHVAVGGSLGQGEDVHGATWQACMERFK